MEKAFRYMCLIMTAILIISSFGIVCNSASLKNTTRDFLGCKEIVQNIKNYELNMTSIIYVKNSAGEWEEYQRIHGDENRIWVDIEQIPQQLIDAFIAIEDQRFYSHYGIDWKRTTGAFLNYLPFVDLYSSNQGGSTITQQLIKNITSDNDKNAIRKLREIGRAFLIEKTIDKTTILEAYLNTISLGNGICGVQVAANYYFNKDVNDLTLIECASLAAITKNPSAYNPMTKPEGNKKRREDVLYKMLQLEKITAKQYIDALETKLVIDKTQQQDFEIPINNYFVDTLINEIIEDLSVKYSCSTDTASIMLYNGGYRIYATVDTDIQEKMEAVYLDQKKYFSQKSSADKTKNVQSAMTIMDYNGNILGVVGGVGEKTVNRGLNRAVDSPRQPGSTMKPLGVYVQAIENDYANFSTVIEDKPLEKYYKDGTPGPKEWYGSYLGDMTVSKALERSANTIPCWLLRDSIGIENSYNFLTQKLGLKHLSDEDKNLSSLALGGCQYGITTTESAAAYAIFGNGGVYYEPTTYTKVIDINDNVVLQANEGNRVIKETTATIMNRLLQNVVYGQEGTGKGISGYNKMRAYAKTGTSSESKDLWMVAGTPYYVGSVWYGFDQPENIHYQGAAAKVWRDIMSSIHKDLENKEFVFSEEVTKKTFCQTTGLRASANCQNKATGFYIEGTDIKYCSGDHPLADVEGETDAETPTDTETPTDSDSDTSTEETPSEDISSDDTSTDSSDETTTEPEDSSSNESDTSSDENSSDASTDDGSSSNESSSSETDNSSGGEDTLQLNSET